MNFRVVFLIIVSAFLLASVIDDSMLISPIHGIHMDDRRPDFRFVGDATLVVDNNKAFDSPLIEVEASHYYEPLSNLPIGTYYWKIKKGTLESEVRQFTIDSVVATKLYSDKLFNEGNVRVGVSKGITGAVVGTLDPGQFLEIENKGVYTSRQDE